MNNHSAEWLIEAPSLWPRLRLKSTIESVTNGFWGEEPTGDGNDVACIRVADFDYDKLRVSNDKLTLRKILPKDAEPRLLKTGDILLEKSGGGEKQPVGRAVLYKGTERAVSSNFVARLRAKPLVTNSDFLSYYLAALYTLRINLRSINQTTGIQNLDGESFFNEPLALPPLPEQRSIARFLDDKTAKIDTLIEKKRRLIELLKEERQAVINRAVTKGLNPNAKMKHSGIEWLGDVPEGWEVVGMTKYLESIVDYRGRTPEKVESGVFLVTARNVKGGAIDYTLSEEFVTHEEYERYMTRGLPRIGDVLFTTEAPLGEAANVDREDIALAQRIIKFRGLPNVLDNYFVKFSILSNSFQFQIQSNATGSTALGIKASKLNQLQILLPPISEQRQIAAFLDQKTDEIDTLIEKAERAISLLTEYRTALITEAVTGKVEVGNA